MTLSGEQYKQLQKALELAFPRSADLAQMVRFQLNENLDSVAGGADLRERIFKLIGWAVSAGRLKELVTGACEERPNNADLQIFVEQFLREPTIESGNTPSAAELEHINTKFGHFVTAQIQQFARSKYVRGLYVHRSLQRQLADFYSTEPELVERVRNLTVDTVSSYIGRFGLALPFLASLPAAYQQMVEARKEVPEESVQGAGQSNASPTKKSSDFLSYQEALTQTRKLQESTTEVTECLKTAQLKASTIPDICLLESVYTELIDVLENTVSVIRETNRLSGTLKLQYILKEKPQVLDTKTSNALKILQPSTLGEMTSQLAACRRGQTSPQARLMVN